MDAREVVLADDDGRHYLAFGGLWGGQLQCWATGSFVADARTPPDDCFNVLKIKNPQGLR